MSAVLARGTSPGVSWPSPERNVSVLGPLQGHQSVGSLHLHSERWSILDGEEHEALVRGAHEDN